MDNNNRWLYGIYLTPQIIFEEYIFQEIKDIIYDYIFVDMFCGTGDLVLPLLNHIPPNMRNDYFRKHIFLFDILPQVVESAVDKVVNHYNVPRDLATKNIFVRDSIANYPDFLTKMELPVCHITNPPFLYISRISQYMNTKNDSNLQRIVNYFKNNKGYQDLYQIAIANDLKKNIQKMIYIIPTNFFYGDTVAKKIRNEVLSFYEIKKTIIFERKIFEDTGLNVAIVFLEKKKEKTKTTITFDAIFIDNKDKCYTQKMILTPQNDYRAGFEFDVFINSLPTNNLEIKYYLMIDEINKNKGDFEVLLINANKYIRSSKEYEKMKFYVNERLYNMIRANILFLKTLDTGKEHEKAGLYEIGKKFEVDGIVALKKQRIQPIPIFVKPFLTVDEQILLMKYFNMVLNYLRKATNSNFMSSYKYSDSEYVRKFLSLSQSKRIIKTFPYPVDKKLEKVIFDEDTEKLVYYLTKGKSTILEKQLKLF